MPYKVIKRITTPRELGVKGDTAGDFLINLQDNLPSHPLDIVLSNGTKLTLGRDKIEIKLPKGEEISPDVVEQIITNGTRFLLEENDNRRPEDRSRIKITMSLGDNTVYFTQGHLERSPEGNVMPMSPMLSSSDDTFLRVLDSNFTNDVSNLDYLMRRQHNRTLQGREEDRTQDIAEKLGFMTVEKDDSIIEVEINGVKDPCMVTRLCIHSNELKDEKELLNSTIKTYRDILSIKEKPLLMIGLNDSIDITIGRDRKTITIEPIYRTDRDIIPRLVKTTIDFIINKEDIEDTKIKYNTNVFIEGDTTGRKIVRYLDNVIDTINRFRDMYGYMITFFATLILIPLIFLFFLYNEAHPTNSYFLATMAIMPSIIFATLVTRYYRKQTLMRTFGQKKFPFYILIGSTISYIIIYKFEYGMYLQIIFYATVAIIGIAILAAAMHLISFVWTKFSQLVTWLCRHIIKLFAKLLSPIIDILINAASRWESKEKESSTFQSNVIKKVRVTSYNIVHSKIADIVWKVFIIIVRIISSLLGAIAVIIFAIAFLPMIVLFVLINFLDRGYWKELERYREDLIEKAIHKYRDQRHLAPSCRVIFRTTECKRLKNPLSGSVKVLKKKIPRLLTVNGITDLADKLIFKDWT